MSEALKFPIVLSQTFIEATRDTGYRSTAAAVAELVDNSVQANAKQIRIFIKEDGDDLQLAVLDDGTGMDTATLRRALQFGGSVRFGDRSGLGRFGMGLPNASVSQARRLDVYTWKAPNACFTSHLDVDDIARGAMAEIPTVHRSALPKWVQEYRGFSGTLVLWSRCDRLDNRRISTITRKLLEPLGRMFRHFITKGVKIWVNEHAVVPVDPLFMNPASPLSGAALFGEPLTFEVRVPGGEGKTSVVTVRFSELPVGKWHEMPVEDKRKYRIVDGAGLSIVRAGREVDYGWWFFGAKRRENYDSWWRGELSFNPELDELFAITHSKQGISPTQELREILTPDLEAVARQLNGRVQDAFATVKETAAKAQPAPPPPAPPEPKGGKPVAAARPVLNGTNGTNGHAHRAVDKKPEPSPAAKPEAADTHAVSVEPLGGKAMFKATKAGKSWRLIINGLHPFYRHVYEPLRGPARRAVELTLIAHARAEANGEAATGTAFRTAWASELADLLEGGGS